jgi:predicted translin family RNA/ssDNA-binding protein
MNLNYAFEKLYNGTTSVKITQQDKAALAKIHVPEIREYLSELKNKLAGKGTNANSHQSAIAQAEQYLTELEAFYDAVKNGRKKPLNLTTARKHIDFVKGEITALEKLV